MRAQHVRRQLRCTVRFVSRGNVLPYEQLQCHERVVRYQKFTKIVHLLHPPWVHTPCLCDPIHGNLRGWDPVNAVANSANRHGWSIGQGTIHSDTAWRSCRNSGMRCQVGNTSASVFAEEHFLSRPAVHFAKFGWNVTWQTLRADVRFKLLDTNDTTSHIYRKANLESTNLLFRAIVCL
jgi:hypothetical protein